MAHVMKMRLQAIIEASTPRSTASPKRYQPEGVCENAREQHAAE
ncbi:hypothetical protein [Bradyrhizobium sp. CCBAU 051011]|nr:hypothetical protein [Bradyrhizobium sp. CCBAU 051011]